jgi:hypothetical protein
MQRHGTVFTTLMGLGQLLKPVNDSLPACCYYLHCASFDYPVLPTTTSDYRNAQERAVKYLGKLDGTLRIALSTTFANLQRPAGEGAKVQWACTWTCARTDYSRPLGQFRRGSGTCKEN